MKLDDILEQLKRLAYDKTIGFNMKGEYEISVDGYPVYVGDLDSEDDFVAFMTYEYELLDYYRGEVEKKTHEITKAPRAYIDTQYLGVHGDYLDVFIWAPFKMKIATLRVAETLSLYRWRIRPLKDVLRDLEEQLKRWDE